MDDWTNYHRINGANYYLPMSKQIDALCALVLEKLTVCWLLLTPEDLGSNPVIGNFWLKRVLLLILRKDDTKEKQLGY